MLRLDVGMGKRCFAKYCTRDLLYTHQNFTNQFTNHVFKLCASINLICVPNSLTCACFSKVAWTKDHKIAKWHPNHFVHCITVRLPCDRKFRLELLMKLDMRGELVCFHAMSVFRVLTTLFDCCVRLWRHEIFVESATTYSYAALFYQFLMMHIPAIALKCLLHHLMLGIVRFMQCQLLAWTPLPHHPLQEESSGLSFSVHQTVILWDDPANYIVHTKLFHFAILAQIRMRYPMVDKNPTWLCKWSPTLPD